MNGNVDQEEEELVITNPPTLLRRSERIAGQRRAC